MTVKRIFIIVLALLPLVACRGKKAQSSGPASREFPAVEVPSFIAAGNETLEYCLRHFWDGFFSGEWPFSPDRILGVRKDEVERQAAVFLSMAEMVPKEEAQNLMAKLFKEMEARQMADSASHVYVLLGDIIVRYLYDVNSPLRDEDLYLPFVKGLAESPLTNEDVRPGYRFEVEACSLNRYGTKASDFAFTDSRGRVRRLYDVKADYTVMFFSNPGCTSCREIVESLEAFPKLDSMIEAGRVSVLCLYIDREIEKWRDYLPNYPANWICGYDHRFIIREDILYNVRAIPSLYLLDREKRVVMKDATTEKLLDFLDKL